MGGCWEKAETSAICTPGRRATTVRLSFLSAPLFSTAYSPYPTGPQTPAHLSTRVYSHSSPYTALYPHHVTPLYLYFAPLYSLVSDNYALLSSIRLPRSPPLQLFPSRPQLVSTRKQETVGTSEAQQRCREAAGEESDAAPRCPCPCCGGGGQVAALWRMEGAPSNSVSKRRKRRTRKTGQASSCRTGRVVIRLAR